MGLASVRTVLQLAVSGLLSVALLSARSVNAQAHDSRPRQDRADELHDWKLGLRARTKDLFDHGWSAYMNHAYPLDELKPLSCEGLQPGSGQAGSVNDVCGNFSLTLIDVADTLAVMGDKEGFDQAVRRIIDDVQFDQDAKVQVFEVTIRVLGGLLSTHLLALPDHPTHPGFDLPWYRSELLDLAVDLADRLLPAFRTPTGIPVARVNLRKGVELGETMETCSAGAGSLLLEWILLSRLTGKPEYEQAATKAFWEVWNRRSEKGLVGNALNAYNGVWIPPLVSHVGAGVDSFLEYAFKAYILTGEESYHDVFQSFYGAVMSFVRDETGFWYRGAALETGERIGVTVDSLAAFLPGLQSMAGDIESATKSHLVYWNLWRRYGAIPETFHCVQREAENLDYPFRPEFVESTYFLYLATKDPFYLEVGEQILVDLEEMGKVLPEDGKGGGCGLSGWRLGHGHEGRLDRMESFALSETLKYLYLLFDTDKHDYSSATVFSTEGHMLFLPRTLIKPPSATRRALRKGENLQCAWTESSVGLSVGVKGRNDWDFARFLTGLELVDAEEDEEWQSPEGWCSLAKADHWTVDVMFGAVEEKEDLSPGKDKLKLVEGGAELLQVRNIKAKVTRRMDGSGYDITHVGPYNLRTGQTLWITDPGVVASFNAAVPPSPPSPPPANKTDDRDAVVSLRIDINGQTWDTLSAGAATFGGIVSPRSATAEKAALYVGSRPVRLVVPPSDQLTACDLIPPLCVRATDDQLLLVKRGGCTFAQKLLVAREAGASGIVVWDSTPSPSIFYSSSGIVQPSASPADWENASHPATEREVVLFLPYSRGVGRKLHKILRTGEKDVRVSVEPENSRRRRSLHRRQGLEESEDRRRLWVGSLPVLNAAVVERLPDIT